MVTNNEVSEKAAKKLNGDGYYRGDVQFEAQGIFERVTRPRCEAVVTGLRLDGKPVPGVHVDSRRPLKDGFPEDIDFYRLDYLDPDEVDLGRQFDAVVPALWLAAGGIGEWETRGAAAFSLPSTSRYGVLFKESSFRQFREALARRTDVTHVWLVTDSEEAFSEMRSALPRDCEYLCYTAIICGTFASIRSGTYEAGAQRLPDRKRRHPCPAIAPRGRRRQER